jgi:hypothetical protein
MMAYIATILTVYAVIIYLIYLERKQASARWVFPFVLALYVIAHGMVISEIVYLPFWREFVTWFAGLPLTMN